LRGLEGGRSRQRLDFVRTGRRPGC
jgi:hypothetical protein